MCNLHRIETLNRRSAIPCVAISLAMFSLMVLQSYYSRKTRQIPWWRHQMETSSALLAICAGKSPVTGEFPSQRPVTRIFDVFFDLRLDEGLRRHRAHYDVTVMTMAAGALCYRVISGNCFDYIGHCLPLGRISTTCAVSVSRNERKCKYLSGFVHKIKHVEDQWCHLINSLAKL